MTGPPLILLHGFPETWRAWLRVAQRLAGDFRIVMPDLRGLGGSPGPASGYDKHSLAGDVRAIARAEFGVTPARSAATTWAATSVSRTP